MRRQPLSCRLISLILAGAFCFSAPGYSQRPIAETDSLPELPAAEESGGQELPPGEETVSDPASAATAARPAKEQGGTATTQPIAQPATESVTEPAAEPSKQYNAIRLRGLNKVTARISTLEAPLGTVMRFGNLEIIAHRCWQTTPENQPEGKPESAGLLEIWESKPDEGPQRLFSGWMFASSPALSALEHPVYDISVLSCAESTATE